MSFGVVKRFDFCVRLPGCAMPAAPDDSPLGHQHGTHHGIGRGAAIAPVGEAQRGSHELGVSHRQNASDAHGGLQTSVREMSVIFCCPTLRDAVIPR